MLVLTIVDMLWCLGCIITFLILMSTQPLIFKENYSTIYEIVYYNDTQDISKTFAFRALVVIFLSMITEYITPNGFAIAIVSCTLGGFLQIWPALVSYKIFTFRVNGQKVKYFLGCLTYVLFCSLLVVITYKFVIPLLNGEKNSYFLIDNSGVQLILSLISYAFVWKVTARLANSGAEKAFINVDDFKQELGIWMRRMEIESPYIDLFDNEIIKYSEQYAISKQLLKSILVLEYLNRGSPLITAYEKILCCFFPTKAIKKDLSIGLGQVKISTAVRVLKKNPQSILKKLFEPDYNIRVCAKYLQALEMDYITQIPYMNRDVMDIYKYIACYYLGFSIETNHKTVDLYATIMRSYDCGRLAKKIEIEHSL